MKEISIKRHKIFSPFRDFINIIRSTAPRFLIVAIHEKKWYLNSVLALFPLRNKHSERTVNVDRVFSHAYYSLNTNTRLKTIFK